MKNRNMKIRKAGIDDLGAVNAIYAYAREQMRKTGNPSQWGDHFPPEEKIINDIQKQNSYVLVFDHEICGVFSFIIGEDETYKTIDGSWLNEKPYGTLHRVASSGAQKGILDCIIAYCKDLMPNIRVDTHSNNLIMQHILEKHGFTRCGIIHVADGSARIAYQKLLEC